MGYLTRYNHSKWWSDRVGEVVWLELLPGEEIIGRVLQVGHHRMIVDCRRSLGSVRTLSSVNLRSIASVRVMREVR